MNETPNHGILLEERGEGGSTGIVSQRMGGTTVRHVLRGPGLLPLHHVLPAMRGLRTALPHPIRRLEPIHVLRGDHGLQRPVRGVAVPLTVLGVGGPVLLQPGGRHQPGAGAGLSADPQLTLRQLHPGLLGLHLVPELRVPDPGVLDGDGGAEGGRICGGVCGAHCVLPHLFVPANAAARGVE